MKIRDYKEVKKIQNESHSLKELRWGLFHILMERLKMGEDYVIIYEGEIVGFLHIRCRSWENYHIINMCIAPSMQGGGIGKYALNWVKDIYRSRGAKIITARTSENNYKTINLCKGLGFTEESRTEGYYEDGSSAINLTIDLK